MVKSPVIEALETAKTAPEDPFALLRHWLDTAEASEPLDFNAMCLATADSSGKPSARIVLLKGLDERGLVFYTNRESRKGEQLAQNENAALCFHWKSLDAQIRIEGTVEQINDAESDSYFDTRPRGSRLGAWASRQSQTLESRSTLAARVKEFDEKFAGNDAIPRPPHWGGYRLKPDRIEFWHEGQDRLHTRLLYIRDGRRWTRALLYP